MTTQLTFDDAPKVYPHAPGSKAGAPETSRAAGDSIRGDARTLRAAVLAELKKGDRTADEAAAALKASVLAIRPRFSELKRLARIVDTGIRRRNASGKMAAAWRLA